MRRSPALRPLSDDHHGALVLARRCRRAASEADGAALARLRDEALAAWAGELAPHFAIEEEALIPALRELGASDHADGILADHARLRSLRERVAQGAPDRALAEALVAFGEQLERHVRYEERRVFAEVQDRLSAAQRDALARAIAAHPRAPAGPPPLG